MPKTDFAVRAESGRPNQLATYIGDVGNLIDGGESGFPDGAMRLAGGCPGYPIASIRSAVSKLNRNWA